jgi:hypothetical protein
MPDSTTTNLMEKVYDLLSELYSSSQDAGQGAFLAFEGLGMSITPEMFSLASGDAPPSPGSAVSTPVLLPELGVERLSVMANTVFEVSGSSIHHSTRTVDKMVEFMLLQSTPGSAAAMATLGAVKEPAEKDFEPTLGSLQGMFRYHPVYANPVNWYDPTSQGNWTAHTIKQDDAPPSTAAATPVAAPVATPIRAVNIPPLSWRVLPTSLRPALALNNMRSMIMPSNVQNAVVHAPTASPALTAAPTQVLQSTAPVAPHMDLRLRRDIPMSRAVAPGLAMLTTAHPGVVQQAARQNGPSGPDIATPVQVTRFNFDPATMMLHPQLLAQATAQLSAAATPQSVATHSMEISFEHCIVTLIRPWFPEMFLMARNWYVPGYERGAFSNGSGVGDTGLLPVLPSGFVMIRNLKISAQWNGDDIAAVTGAISLGPLSLMGSSFDSGSNTLSCPGMQIIGWFCEALPVLPPMPDPEMSATSVGSAPSSAIASTTTATGDDAAPGAGDPGAPSSATADISAPSTADIPADASH